MRRMNPLVLCILLMLLVACAKKDASPINEKIPVPTGQVSVGTECYRGFVVDNILHSDHGGDIHYNVYVPESYDGKTPFALYFTLPGYEGLYFQGVAENLKSEVFGFEAQKYNENMIVVAPQLSDWEETSANQTIALIEYLLENYSIDTNQVYASGYSGGGETMSLGLSKRPDLFTAYLQVSSKWDGEYETVAKERVPIYFVIGENDEYYGSLPTKTAYDTLYSLYEKQGMINEHGGGGLFAYDTQIMSWLFEKKVS